MKHLLKISYLIIFAAIVASVSTSCGNDNEPFEDDWLFENKEEPTTLATRSIGWTEDSQGTQYPSLSDIKADLTFKRMAAAAWESTMNALTDSTRCEYGFMIYWTNNSLEFGTITAGPVVKGCEGTKGSWNADLSTRKSEICAVYHCHTPMPKCCSNDKSRATGLSNGDRAWSNKNGIPLLAEDFEVERIRYTENYRSLSHKTYESDLKQRVR